MHPRYGRRLPLNQEQGLRLSLLSWTIPSIAVLLAMAIHFFDSPRAVPFFISETDAPGLQDHVFTVGLSIAGVVQMAYAWHLYHTLNVERETLWFVATLCGLFASANTVLVSHFDMYNHINPHIATAMFAFGGGIVWAYLSSRALGLHATRTGTALRRLGGLLALVGFVVMVTSFELAARGIDSTNLTTEAFLNEAQHGIRFAAPAEYLLVAGLFVCLASFRFELISVKDEASTNQ